MSARVRPILFVEDDPHDVMLTSLALERAGLSARLVVAGDGEQACRLLQDPAFDPELVLLDLNLPKVGGLEVLEKIRCDKKRKGLAVVILTSSDEPRDRARSAELRVDAYLLKPMSLEGYDVVIQAMDRFLGRAGES
jgi:CheY-like chemotaxis protein